MYSNEKNYFVLLVFISFVIFPISAESKQKKKQRLPTEQELLESLHPKYKRNPAPSGMKLLPGFQHKGSTDFEGNWAGEIWKKAGLKFTYEIGMNEGMAIIPEKKNEYIEYSEQTINGRIIRTAFTKEKIFTISISHFDLSNQANFYAKVQKIEEAKDMITMVIDCIKTKEPVPVKNHIR